MSVKEIKKILKQINDPDSYQMFPVDLSHPTYWIWGVENIKLKDMDSRLYALRPDKYRFDVFVWGGYISPNDYVFKQVGNDFYVKFKRANFPQFIENTNDPSYTVDAFGNPATPWVFENSDEVKIKGDFEYIA